MALIKCKECGKEISNQAKKCPSCGAPARKKTGCFTWLAAGFIGLIVLSWICGSFFKNKTATEPPTVYLNEPLTVGNFTIKVTKVTETKKLGKYTAAMFLKLSAQMTNNGPESEGLSSFLKSKRGKEFACALDEMAITDNVKGAFDTKANFKEGETKKGFIPFICGSYLQGVKVKERNSHPSDYKMLIWNKEGTETGYIILTERPH